MVQMGLAVVGAILGIPLRTKGQSPTIDDQGPLNGPQVVEHTHALWEELGRNGAQRMRVLGTHTIRQAQASTHMHSHTHTHTHSHTHTHTHTHTHHVHSHTHTHIHSCTNACMRHVHARTHARTHQKPTFLMRSLVCK